MDELLLIGAGLTADEKIRRHLEREGYEVLQAADRAEGLVTLRARRPFVVIVDQLLQGDDGVEVLKQLKAERPSCEVILVTPGGKMDTAIEVLRAGALDYLRRPIDLQQLDVALGRARERRPQREASEPPLLLAVDDHEPTLRRLLQVLEKENYRVLGAANGEEAVRLFREKRIDLILADIRMPRMDGLQLLRETKGQGADVEVIVMTGYGDEDSVVQALRDGAINFLRKPIDIEQMLLAIQKALDFQTTRRSLAHRNRDVELMQELVVRLTRKLELVVETPRELSAQAVDFLQQLVDSLPLGIVVAGVDREVLYANRPVIECLGRPPETLSMETLRPLGLPTVGEEQFEQAFTRALSSGAGTVETLVLSQWSFVVMTPLTLVRADGSRRYVALAIRGERSKPDALPQ